MTEDTRTRGSENSVPRIDIAVGEVQVGHLCEDVRISRGVGLVNAAEFSMRRDDICNSGLDYSSGVTIAFEWAGVSYPQFTGLIETVTPGEAVASFRCTGVAPLRDMNIGGFAYDGIGTPEIIWTITREAGWPEGKIDIDGIDLLTEEEIEVLIPLRGLRVDEEIRVGATDIVPASSVNWVSMPWPTGQPAQIGPPDEILSALLAHGAFARARYRMARIYDAEQAGIRDAEFAAAWFSTRLRFAYACLPDRRMQPFNRANFIARPMVSSLAAVRGLTTGRRWLRVVQKSPKIVDAALPKAVDGSLDPSLPDAISGRDREAVLAFWRSLDVLNPLASVIALWDAIEFYAGGTAAPKLFSQEQLQSLANGIPSWMNKDQRKRYTNILSSLNNAPLFARLRVAIEADGVPVTESEIEVLSRLRKVRNPAQHGRESRPPDPDDLRRAWSIVARLLVYRLANRSAIEEEPR